MNTAQLRGRLLLGLLLIEAGALQPGCVGQAQQPSTLPRPPLTRAQAQASWVKAERVLETRCVACHGCYDAPCQLKLDTYAGVARGGSGQQIYQAGRLRAMEPTRLGIDARDLQTWRQKGFHPVLPERSPQGARSDPRASLLLRLLELKRAHPLPAASEMAKSFTLELDRKQTCAESGNFDGFAREHPLWGMPYGLPGLSPSEHAALVDWVIDGAPHEEPTAPAAAITDSIGEWEAFLNEPSLKSRLMSRYVYEHLFLASLYFKDVDEASFFRLVRSTTPPGTAVDEIPTRRPFDDPRSDHLYYRFVRREGQPLAKTHMVYPLGAARLKRYRALFIEPDYAVERLPTYEPETAANPFRAFAALPVGSRYRFMLEEAEFTMMGFIKGPVCRGQVALNVIEDRFWITFLDPDVPWMGDEAAFLAAEQPDLDMPAEKGSSSMSVLWQRYTSAHDRYAKARNGFLEKATAGGKRVAPPLIWDGDGSNSNAALTVFRHFDSATIVQGLVGGPPKTAWVVDYPLLERIHYLLIAGFDVFGNVSHQITTRLYMDFLRMEGESNFLMFLPPARRRELVANWYRGVGGAHRERVEMELLGFGAPPRIQYQTAAPEEELHAMLRSRVKRVLAHRYELPDTETSLARLERLNGVAAPWLPEVSFVAVRNSDQSQVNFSILRESAHTNVAHLFSEESRRVKAEDRVSVVPGFLGAYPNALYAVDRGEIDAFVEAISRLDGEAAYRALRLRFGVLRGSDRFWQHSDRINDENRKLGPVDSGRFDYSRLEAL